jgi:hypothetical protein
MHAGGGGLVVEEEYTCLRNVFVGSSLTHPLDPIYHGYGRGHEAHAKAGRRPTSREEAYAQRH